MKQLFFTLFTLLSISASAQNTQNQEALDTLSQEQKEIAISLAEQFILHTVDSIMEEGMYMQALDALDSIQTNWKKITGKGPFPLLYMKKGHIYMCLEEWQQLIDTTNECIKYNKETMSDRSAAILYNMQGIGYRNLEDYKNAIRSFEFAVSYYSKVGDCGSQGDMLCGIAYSYYKMGKPSAASSFYEKGFIKFLQYFNITKKQLLQSNLKVDDSSKESLMGLFGSHLYDMAIYKQDNGDRLASKDYLLMSAHCGNSLARSEYQRLYGRY